jgi:hypothetical protein
MFISYWYLVKSFTKSCFDFANNLSMRLFISGKHSHIHASIRCIKCKVYTIVQCCANLHPPNLLPRHVVLLENSPAPSIRWVARQHATSRAETRLFLSVEFMRYAIYIYTHSDSRVPLPVLVPFIQFFDLSVHVMLLYIYPDTCIIIIYTIFD